MSLEGLKLGALYSYDCGKAKMLKINGILARFIATRMDSEKTAEALRKLISYDWYRLIAQNSGIADFFSEEIVQAYWTGNDLTKSISLQGKELFLFHNFTVLTSPMPDLISRNNCKMSLGVVDNINGENLLVSYDALVSKEGKLELERQKITIKKGFLQEVRETDWIFFHVGIARKLATQKEMTSLCEKTIQAIRLFNDQASQT
ncbi:MAG: hypothetical protein Q8N88_04105 [Nanoarchaeota archaeon]|nr:hypothetical protein [Nanoarchaeota archaeon]